MSFSARLDNGESGLGWAVAAIPKRKVLTFVLGRALDEFLDKKVLEMQDQLFVYSGQGWRNDGNFKLAKRIGVKRQGSRFAARPYSVVLGFCGVDGALFAPVHPMQTEDFVDISAVQRPLLQRSKLARLRAGLSLEESAPVFQSTDVYAKDRLSYRALY